MKEKMKRGVTKGQTQLDTATDEEWQRELIRNADGLENFFTTLRSGRGAQPQNRVDHNPDWNFFRDFPVKNVRLLWQDTGLLSHATFTGSRVRTDAMTRWRNFQEWQRSVRERTNCLSRWNQRSRRLREGIDGRDGQQHGLLSLRKRDSCWGTGEERGGRECGLRLL